MCRYNVCTWSFPWEFWLSFKLHTFWSIASSKKKELYMSKDIVGYLMCACLLTLSPHPYMWLYGRVCVSGLSNGHFPVLLLFVLFFYLLRSPLSLAWARLLCWVLLLVSDMVLSLLTCACQFNQTRTLCAGLPSALCKAIIFPVVFIAKLIIGYLCVVNSYISYGIWCICVGGIASTASSVLLLCKINNFFMLISSFCTKTWAWF